MYICIYIIIIQHDIYILTSLVYCHSDNVYIHVFPLSILILLIANSKYHIYICIWHGLILKIFFQYNRNDKLMQAQPLPTAKHPALL